VGNPVVTRKGVWDGECESPVNRENHVAQERESGGRKSERIVDQEEPEKKLKEEQKKSKSPPSASRAKKMPPTCKNLTQNITTVNEREEVKNTRLTLFKQRGGKEGGQTG